MKYLKIFISQPVMLTCTLREWRDSNRDSSDTLFSEVFKKTYTILHKMVLIALSVQYTLHKSGGIAMPRTKYNYSVESLSYINSINLGNPANQVNFKAVLPASGE